MSHDLENLRRALIASWPSLLEELLGKPSRRTARQWRWNRRGSVSAVMGGAKVGTWFDHAAGSGGGPFELIARERGGDWRVAADWARTWLGLPAWTPMGRPPTPFLEVVPAPPTNDVGVPSEAEQRRTAQRAAQLTWERADPADPDQAYLRRKGVQPFGIRMDMGATLIIPLIGLDGTIHSIQRIYEDGTKRFLSGGAKADHFALIGGPLETAPAILLCEGWATGATAHAATDLPVVAAMDAGNLVRVAPLVQARFPAATLVILADNDTQPGRDTNPGVAAATAAARATQSLLAIPPIPGDFNDLAAACGIDAVRDAIWAAAPPAALTPTYPLAILDLTNIRAMLDDQVAEFMADVAAHWTADPLDTEPLTEPAASPWSAGWHDGATAPREPVCS
jgi:putative DNA primase/helicase